MASIFNLVILTYAFRLEAGEPEDHYQQVDGRSTRSSHVSYGTLLRYRAFWACAVFLLVYVGNEYVLGGWVVSFMLKARHASMQLANLCSTVFWWGMALGRFVIGAILDLVGLKRGVSVCILCLLGCQMLLIVFTAPETSAVLMFVSGFFCGPLFPSCIVQLALLLPSETHIAAVSLIASIGQVGGALLPFLFGAVSQRFGIEVFPVAVSCQVVACCLTWLVVSRTEPALKKRSPRES